MIFKFTFQPESADFYSKVGPEELLASGTLDECRIAWQNTITGKYGDPSNAETIGLLTKLGHVHSFHKGGKGLYRISWAPEMVDNPTYEVRPAAERDAWVSGGDSMEEAEAQMRRMGDGPSTLLVLRNTWNGAQAVYEANNLGYLTLKGTYEQFYGAR